MMNEIPVCERPATMADRFADIKVTSDDISAAIRRLDAVLYGDTTQNNCPEKMPQPSCFEESVEIYQKNLEETREMLYSIMNRIGVQ